jgi:hypothetical protein
MYHRAGPAYVDPHAPTNDGPLQETTWMLRTAGLP